MKISIVTPSFNQGHFLEETILSILNQGYKNLELIIIDGGSTDESVEIIKKYQSHIQYWVSEPDNGQSHAINKGFERCTGDVIAWLNSDDLYTENALGRVGTFFEKNPGIDFIHGSAIVFGPETKTLIQGMTYQDKAVYLAGMPSPQPSFFFRKEMLTKVGQLDEALHYGMDYDFFLRMALVGLPYYMTGDPIARYRIHGSSKSNTSKIAFAREWGAIFSTLLRSVDYQLGIEAFGDLRLYNPREGHYQSEKLESATMERATGLALINIATFLNVGQERAKALEILDYVKKHFKPVYDNMHLAIPHSKIRIKNLLRIK